MRIPGLAVKIDEAAVAWRPTRHRGIEWAPLHVAGSDAYDDGDAQAGGVAATAGAPEFQGDSRHAARDSTVLIRMQPGCGYPPHRHVGVEEVLVLRGGYRDERGEHAAGAYLRYAAGSVHAPIATGHADLPEGPDNPSCLLFASARGGVENLGS